MAYNANSVRECTDKNRKLNDSAFFTDSPNGEKNDRHWLLYSPSTGRVFCFVCKLFSSNSTVALANQGFDSWSNINRLGQHELSQNHRQALATYANRLSNIQTLDKVIAEEFDKERSYWREVLRRVVSTVKFITRAICYII